MTRGGETGDRAEFLHACVSFSDIQRVLVLFTQGLTGRRLHLKPLDAQPADGRMRAVATDGESIHLPAEIASFASTRHNLGAYRIAVLHQIGYLENGTFAFDLATAAARMPLALPNPATTQVLRRFLPLPQVADLERFFATGRRPALLRRVFSTLEDLRIDTAMRRRYPGARADLDRVLAHALATRPQPDARRRLAALIEALLQYSLGADRSTLLSRDDTGLCARMFDAAQALLHPQASVYDSARCALDICALLESLFRRQPSGRAAQPGSMVDLPSSVEGSPGDAAGGQSAGEGDSDAEPGEEDIEGPGVEFRGELRPDLVYRRMRGGLPGSFPRTALFPATTDPEPVAEPGEDDGAKTPIVQSRTSATRRPALDGTRSLLYDEWDYHTRTYLKGWCRLYEKRLRGEDFEFIGDVRRRNAALANRVKRQFSFIKPESWHRVHRASDGDEFELDAVIDAVIDRRTGHVSDEYLYVRRDRGLREVAAAFLVDMSASTDFPVPDPVVRPTVLPGTQSVENDPYLWGRSSAPIDATPSPPKRRVIDVAKEALALMCDALQTLGDSHAVYGFSGDGRENVEFNVIKDFGDVPSARGWAALAAIEPRRSTRMGPAIRHALAKLARQPLRQKVLIIVSDGYPEDRDYGPDRRDREYGILDTARALQEAERAGISTFCITIDPAGHDYLRRMCEEHRYLVIDDVTALPAELTKVYRALTRAAGAGRRPAHRRAPSVAGDRH